MSNQDKPCSVELRCLSTFKYELNQLDVRIKHATEDEMSILNAAKIYLQGRVNSIQSRI